MSVVQDVASRALQMPAKPEADAGIPAALAG